MTRRTSGEPRPSPWRGWATLPSERRTARRRWKELESEAFEIALLDLKLAGESGLDLLPQLLKLNPRLEVIVFTAYSSVETAVEAMRRGAVDYIPKPFTPDQIRRVLRRTMEARKLRERVAELESRISADSPSPELVSAEPAMQKVYEMASKAAGMPATVLLLGESGTGKTVLARALHANSPQKDNAFVTVNCPSLSRELLESELFGHVKGRRSQGRRATRLARLRWRKDGTLVFGRDWGFAVGDSAEVVAVIAGEGEHERVGEAKTRKANLRVVAATNRDLEKSVAEGRFRERPVLPVERHLDPDAAVARTARGPWRGWPWELPGVFSRGSAAKTCAEFSREADQALCRYSWPGNLRELRNVIERAVILVRRFPRLTSRTCRRSFGRRDRLHRQAKPGQGR